jgi:hypothetical protein
MNKIVHFFLLLFFVSSAHADSYQLKDIQARRINLIRCFDVVHSYMYAVRSGGSWGDMGTACQSSDTYNKKIIDSYQSEEQKRDARAMITQWIIAMRSAGKPNEQSEQAKFETLANILELQLK